MLPTRVRGVTLLRGELLKPVSSLVRRPAWVFTVRPGPVEMEAVTPAGGQAGGQAGHGRQTGDGSAGAQVPSFGWCQDDCMCPRLEDPHPQPCKPPHPFLPSSRPAYLQQGSGQLRQPHGACE